MKGMKLIAPNQLGDNVIDLIGKEWMLVSAGNSDKFNSMTASWGSIGFQFNCNVATIVVRPERYTFEFIESSTHFTLTILESGHREALMVMGRKSGRDCDKVQMSGLTPCFTPSGNPTYEQARIVLECRKIYGQMMDPEAFIGDSLIDKWYDDAHGNFHKIFLGEIENCWIKE